MSLSEVPFFNHTFSEDSWTNGWTVGAGIDYAIAPYTTVGVTYDYIDLSSERFSGFDNSGFVVTTIDADVEPIHSVMARLSFQLGKRHEEVPRLK